MTDTNTLFAAIHHRADTLQGDDLAHFGRALVYAGASIVGQSEGASELSRMLDAMARSAEGAVREGEREAAKA